MEKVPLTLGEVNLPKENKNSLSSPVDFWQRILAAGILSASLSHGEATKAAEIPPNATWEQGVSVLRNSAFLESEEMMGTYVELQNQRGSFLNQTLLNASNAGGEFEVNDFVKVIDGYAKDKKSGIKLVCNFHTHPIDGIDTFLGVLTHGINSQKIRELRNEHQTSGKIVLPLYDNSPSRDDFESAKEIDDAVKQKLNADVTVRHAAMSVRGVWYYRNSTSEDDKDFGKVRETQIEDTKELEGLEREKIHLTLDLEEDVSSAVSSLSPSALDTLAELLSEKARIKIDEVRQRAKQPRAMGKYDGVNFVIITELQTAVKDGDAEITEKILGKTGLEALNQLKKLKNKTAELEVKTKKPIDHALINYTRALRSRDGERIEQALGALYGAYYVEGKRVRFVQYDELSKEPPCAGVDYKPK